MGKIYAEVIGDPVAHSKSPLLHGFWLRTVGINADYRASRVEARDIGAFLESRRQDPDWLGCNVTVPHKQAVIPFVTTLAHLARESGAVNTILRQPDGTLMGGNSDVPGIVDALPGLSGNVREACLIGSGGAALAALAAFRLLGVERVGVNVRNRDKGEQMLRGAGFQGRVGAVDDAANLGAADLIVNASTLGMAGKDPMPASLLDIVGSLGGKPVTVLDMVYAPLETELLRAARAGGLHAVDGLAMLIGQAAVAFFAFFGVPAPREHDSELRALLTS